MSKRIWLIAFAVSALGLQGWGCGSSDEVTTISKTDFIAAGNQICVEAVKRQAATYETIVSQAKGKQVTPADGKAAEQELADVVASSVENMVDEFKDLGSPEGKEETVAKMLGEYERGAEATQADPQAFLQAEAFDAADKSAKALGLTKCESI